MSQGLRDHITNKINNQFAARIQKAKTTADETLPKLITDKFVSSIITPEAEEAAKNPLLRPYIQFTHEFIINFVIGHEHHQVALPLNRSVPAKLSSGAYGTTAITAYKIAENTELYKIILECYTDYRIAVEERGILHNKVKELLNQATTLRQVVKVWPSVLEYCDSQTVRRYHEKAEYTKNEANLETIVDDSFKSTLLKARMSDAIK